MTDFEDRERHDAGPADTFDDLGISDLPPEAGSHYLLLRLTQVRERLQTAARAFSRHADSASEPPADDEADVKLHDLPPTTRSHYLLLALRARLQRLRAILASRRKTSVLTRTQKRVRSGRVLTAFGLCIALLLLLVGNVPALRSQLIGLVVPATPTPTTIVYEFAHDNIPIIIDHPNDPFMKMTATATTNLAPLPATCPHASMLEYFLTPLDPPGLGNYPIWLTGFSGPMAALVYLQSTTRSISAVSGWYQPLSLFISQGLKGTIILHGIDQNGRGNVEFSYVSSSYATPSTTNDLHFAPVLTLSLQHPGAIHFNTSGKWEMTDIDILVPRAGCYEIQASWSNSTWTQYFAAGNLG